MTITTPEAALDISITSYHIEENNSGIFSQTKCSPILTSTNLAPSSSLNLHWSFLQLVKLMQLTTEQTNENGQGNHGECGLGECKLNKAFLSSQLSSQFSSRERFLNRVLMLLLSFHIG